MENYALQFISENLHNEIQRPVVEFLLSNMTETELKAAMSICPDDQIAFILATRSGFNQGQKYSAMSLNRLLRLYSDSDKNKSRIAQIYLQYRFSYLSVKEKHRVIKAFLEGGKADRRWACAMLRDYWDNKFLPIITQLWETEHLTYTALLIVKRAPLDYVRQNADKFPPSLITMLSFRLKDDPTYTVRRDGVKPEKYLHAMAICGKTMDYETAKDALYHIFIKYVEECIRSRRPEGGLGYSYSLIHSEVIWKTLKRLQRLEQHLLVIYFIQMFLNILSIFESKTEVVTTEEDNELFVAIARQIAGMAFNDDFEKLHNGEQYTLSEEEARPEDETDEDENAESENALTLSEKTEILEQMSDNSKAFKNLTDTLDLAPF